jgi:hypothetical protein
MPPLSHTLAQTGPTWQQAIAPVVEHVAHTLHRSSRNLASVASRSVKASARGEQPKRAQRELPTRLTRSNKLTSGTSPRAPTPPKACLTCGVVLQSRDRKMRRRYCDDCSRTRKSESATAMQARLRARPLAEHWGLDSADVPDQNLFTREIMPSLQSVMLRDIARATGCSLGHAGNIRQGRVVPDPRHWRVLAELPGSGVIPANPLRRGSGRRNSR